MMCVCAKATGEDAHRAGDEHAEAAPPQALVQGRTLRARQQRQREKEPT